VKPRFYFDYSFIFLLFLSLVLIFTHLGSTHLWEDEAETALVAKTIWSHGIPKITDGINYFYQEQGKRVGYGDVWAWTPWLQFYVTAASFKVFGTDEWAARLPFALAGFIAILFQFRISKLLFGRPTALFSTLLLVTSVPFLLYVRQCRYYSFVILGTLWAVDSLIYFKEKHSNRWPSISLFSALFIMFHANYIAWFGMLFSILAYAFFPSIPKTARKLILMTGALAFLVNLPWFLLFKPLHEKIMTFDAGIFLESIIFYIESFNHYVIPFFLLILIPISLRFLPKNDNRPVFPVDEKKWIYFFVFLICFTFFFSLFGPARVFRYMVGIIPIVIMLFSLLLIQLWQRNKIIAFLIVFILIFTNFFHIFLYQPIKKMIPSSARHLKGRFESPLSLYIHELINPPRGSTQIIAEYLKQHASPKDLVIVTYGDLPIMFYTGLRVIGGLSFEALKEATAADWIVTRKVLVSDEDARVMMYLIDNLSWERYEKINLGVIDFPWDNIPEPNAHQFKSLGFNSDWQIQIYHKLKANEPSRKAEPPSIFYFTPAQKTIYGTNEFKQELTRYLLWLKERTGAIGRVN